MSQSLYAICGAGGCGRGILPLARQMLGSSGVSLDQLVFVDDAIKDTLMNGHAVISPRRIFGKKCIKKICCLSYCK